MKLLDFIARLRRIRGVLGDYFAVGGGRISRRPITSRAALADYLNAQASFIAQTCLYGYLKTRAGTRHPEVFENPQMARSLNIAKWQIWVACVSDLAVYIGGLVRLAAPTSDARARQIVAHACEGLFADIGAPPDAGDAFLAGCDACRARLREHSWHDFRDDESVFCLSPAALLEWSPVADELKQRDADIVKNSMRFRWREIRRRTRQLLDPAALLREVSD